MLAALSGRKHEVLTGVSLRSGDREVGSVERTRSWTSLPLSADEIAWYVHSGEGLGQGRRLRHPGAGVAVRHADSRVVLERGWLAGRGGCYS